MTALAIPRPAAGVDVWSVCDQIEAEMPAIDDVGLLHDAKAKLSAIDQYLAQTSIEGRARVSATMRRLEVRIGELMGAAKRGRPAGNPPRTEDFSDRAKADFREMAANAEVVEEAIAESTDGSPASRNKVLNRIRERRRDSESVEERDRREEQERIERCADRVRMFLKGARQVRDLAGDPRRDRILAELSSGELALFYELEGSITWTTG